MPTIEKTVKDSNDNWVDSNTAKIGDTVEYKAVITVKTANTNYVMHDTMTDGLTFNKDSVKVTVSGADVPTTKYTLSAPGTKGETFSIAFDNNYIASLPADTKIEVTYNAVVNEKAKIDPGANENEAYLTFGNSQETAHDKTYTYLYQFDLIKYSGTSGKLLGGAQFILYDAETGGNEIKLVKDNTTGIYRVATATEIANHNTVDHIETVPGRTVHISGLDKRSTGWMRFFLPPVIMTCQGVLKSICKVVPKLHLPTVSLTAMMRQTPVPSAVSPSSTTPALPCPAPAASAPPSSTLLAAA